MPQSENSQPDPLSKTKRKNEMLELQKLGKTLIELPVSLLAKMPLPEELLDAIHLGHTLKSHEAMRRHLQYIGKLMREIDPEPIRAALKKVQNMKAQETTQFHLVEHWRDVLVSGDDHKVQEFIEAYPQADRQKLRQLIRKSKNDKLNQKDSGGLTLLFRYLREILV